jgi:hypothetical protein
MMPVRAKIMNSGSERDAGHGARQHEAEEDRRLALELVARESVAAGHADPERDERRGDRDDQRIAEIGPDRNAALART